VRRRTEINTGAVPDGEVLCEIPVRDVYSYLEPDGICNPVRHRYLEPDGICNPVRNVLRLKRCGRGSRRELPRPAQKIKLTCGVLVLEPDGICNPVRNVLRLKRCGRGCKPRPAQKKRCGRGCKPRPALRYPAGLGLKSIQETISRWQNPLVS
jgi:hypothetical protein